MNEPDKELDGWIDALQGKPGASDPTAKALREAIQAERAEQERRLQPEVELAEQRLLARLRREGLLQEERKPVVKLAQKSGWNLLHYLQRPLQKQSAAAFAVAASLMLAVGIGLMNFAGQTEFDDLAAVRGGAANPILLAENPQSVADDLQSKLHMLGAKARVVLINKDELILRINVPAEAESEKIHQLLQQNGVTVVGSPPYRISIKRRR